MTICVVPLLVALLKGVQRKLTVTSGCKSGLHKSAAMMHLTEGRTQAQLHPHSSTLDKKK